MKILAIEKEKPGTRPESFRPFLKAEAARIWELNRSGVLREFYFEEGRHRAVLILECVDAPDARAVLASLPLVREKLIEFDIMPLSPYTGFERLFENR
jgi:muconolactone delta-isomerase